jgi:AbrB family looped-hinge helix DNA binding protein
LNVPDQDFAVVKIGPQGRIVIPAHLRKSLGVVPGDELVARMEGQRLVLESRAAAGARLLGMFAHLATDVSIVDELIAERREEARREEAEWPE